MNTRIILLLVILFGCFEQPARAQNKKAPSRRIARERLRRQAEKKAEAERRHERMSQQSHRDAKKTEPPVERLAGREPWGPSIRQFIADAPPQIKWKGFQHELLKFDAHFNTGLHRSSEHEINHWIERNIAGGSIRHSGFRGVLRELAIVMHLKAEGHTEVNWNRARESVIVPVAGKEIDLGPRVIDVIARKTQSERPTHFEIKNGDLNKVLRKHEIKLLEQKASVEQLVRTCDPAGSISVSREFREMVKDIWLARTDGRHTVWVVNNAPANLGVFLNHYGIEIHLVH
ncbi:MAG: hypothetical protein WBD31_11510 [Rubripirellula sp.]